jgi:hypothetical protein
MPITSTEPTVTSAIRPAVNPITPTPSTATADHNSRPRPSQRSNCAETTPAAVLPAANAATCSPATE